MFRKLLFFLILAGLGFGIYTGINKAMDAFHTPKISISPIISGAVAGKSGAISSIGLHTGSTTESNIKNNQPSFFARIWARLKGLFTSNTVPASGTVSTFTGTSEELSSGIDMSGFNSSTGTEITGDVLSGIINSGMEFNELTSNEGSGKAENVVKIGSNDISSQKITTKATTTVKKPTTTKTTSKPTTSGKDPILDALF